MAGITHKQSADNPLCFDDTQSVKDVVSERFQQAHIETDAYCIRVRGTLKSKFGSSTEVVFWAFLDRAHVAFKHTQLRPLSWSQLVRLLIFSIAVLSLIGWYIWWLTTNACLSVQVNVDTARVIANSVATLLIFSMVPMLGVLSGFVNAEIGVPLQTRITETEMTLGSLAGGSWDNEVNGSAAAKHLIEAIEAYRRSLARGVTHQ